MSQVLLFILNNIVLLAFVASVKWCCPLVSFQIKKVSTVPNNKLLDFWSFFEIFTFSKIHLILVAEKYGSINKPVFLLKIFSYFFCLSFSQYSWVLLSCQTIALYTGLPVFLFHRIVVSLWLVIPILNIFPFSRDAFLITFFKALRVVNQISFGLCSTHPFFGKYWLNSNWDVNFILPSKSKRIALDDVVPWSIATRNFFTILVYT